MNSSSSRLRRDGESNQQSDRVIGILDLDCFEVQIYLKYIHRKNWRKILNTRPVILTITNNPRIISLNYIAKQMGLSREVSSEVAVSSTPGLLVLIKENKHNKPETDRLRSTSQSVFETLFDFRMKYGMQFVIEFASCDEFYLDLTEDVENFLKYSCLISSDIFGENVFLYGNKKVVQGKDVLIRCNAQRNNPEYYRERRFIIAGAIMERIQKHILEELDLNCSAGVGSNRLLAKLALSYRRPQGITILEDSAVSRYSRTVSIDSIPGLKGKGKGKVAVANARNYFLKEEVFMSELCALSFSELLRCLRCDLELGRKVFELVRGRCEDPVVWRSCTKVVSSSGRMNYEKFSNKKECMDEFNRSLTVTSEDLSEKLVMDSEVNKRIAKKIAATFTTALSANTVTIYNFWFDDRDSIFHSLQEEYFDSVYNKQGGCLVNHVKLTAHF